MSSFEESVCHLFHGELISRITGHFKNFSFWRTLQYGTVPYRARPREMAYFFQLLIKKCVGTRVGILASYLGLRKFRSKFA